MTQLRAGTRPRGWGTGCVGWLRPSLGAAPGRSVPPWGGRVGPASQHPREEGGFMFKYWGGHLIFRLLAMLCRCLGWERGRKASSWGIRRDTAGLGCVVLGGRKGNNLGLWDEARGPAPKARGCLRGGEPGARPPQPGFLGPGDAFPSPCSPHPFPFRAEATVVTARN